MFPTIELRSERARASVVPARGGLVTQFSVDGVELLYLDESTLGDPGKNVRGGIPVLFPSPGKLAGDAWARAGARGTLKQHGFARTLPWQLVGQSPAALALALEDDAGTRAQYPWSFRAELEVALEADRLLLRQRVHNRSASAMPFGFGFHPYFAVPPADKEAARIDTGATRAFDNVGKRAVELSGAGMDVGAGEIDLHLLDHGRSGAALSWSGGRSRVRLRGSPDYTHWVIWSLPDRAFVCLEPWTCPGDALNSGDRIIELAPGAAWEGWIEIAAG